MYKLIVKLKVFLSRSIPNWIKTIHSENRAENHHMLISIALLNFYDPPATKRYQTAFCASFFFCYEIGIEILIQWNKLLWRIFKMKTWIDNRPLMCSNVYLASSSLFPFHFMNAHSKWLNWNVLSAQFSSAIYLFTAFVHCSFPCGFCAQFKFISVFEWKPNRRIP